MKKHLFLMLTVLGIVSMFASCSSDDDTVNSPIVGTWTTYDDIETGEITFSSNGTVTANSTLKRNGAMKEDVGTYFVSGTKLTINWQKARTYNSISHEWSDYKDDAETVVITYAIKNNTLIFLEMEGEESNQPIYYTRK